MGSEKDTSYEEVERYLLEGRPFVVTDGARGLPMAVPCPYLGFTSLKWQIST